MRLGVFVLLLCAMAGEACGAGYLVCVSNERSDDMSVIDGATQEVIATIPVGKRPRGIHASPDGKFVYLALSGNPIMGPPQFDAQGNLIEREPAPEDIDQSAHGIGVVDLGERKFVKQLAAGSDPEEFAISLDGKRLYVTNEDVATVSVLNVETGEVEGLVRVKEEPEGAELSPDGTQVYITCETNGEIFVIDTETNRSVADFTVGGRPRTVAFAPDGSRAYIPSETAARINVVDTEKAAVIGEIALPEGSRPMGTAMSADGSQLYVSNGRGGTIAVIDVGEEKVTKLIEAGTRPWGIALSPDGKHLYVANGPSNDVSVIDVEAQEEVAKIAAGESPWGIAVVRMD